MSSRRVVLVVFLVTLVSGLVATCADDPVTPVNLAPRAPSNPIPSHDKQNVPVTTTLRWTASDPDQDVMMYNIYFGTSSPPPDMGQQSEAEYDPPGDLKFHTDYYWKINVSDTYHNIAGPVWHFTTVANQEPNPPSNPVPLHGAVDVSLNVTLQWTASDPEGDPLTFDVYLDTVDPPATKVASDIAAASFTPLLMYGTTYYWRIAVKDDHAHQIQGDVWSFSTLGSVAFRFSIRHDPTGLEDFVAVTSDPDVIAMARAQLALAPGERTLHIHGPIAAGGGGHNLSWGWRFVPGEWELVQFSMELCDGNPSAVEADIDYWVNTIGVFCPWNSYVEEEIP